MFGLLQSQFVLHFGLRFILELRGWREMKRALLHKTKLEEFKQFLTENQIQFRDGKGDYQVLQVEVDGRFYPIYERHSGDHFTTVDQLKGLVRKFIAWDVV